MADPHGASTAAAPVSALSRLLADFDQLAAFFSGWHGRFEQLSAGRFDGRLRLVRGQTVRLVAIDFNQMILARGRQAPGLISVYAVNPANAGGLWHGRRLDPGQLVVHGPDADTNHRSARRATTVGLPVPADYMATAARTLTGGERDGLPNSWAALTPSPEAYSTISRCLHELFTHALEDDAFLGSAEGQQLEQNCVRAVVAGIAAANTTRRRMPSLPGRMGLVRRAEDLMRASLRRPLGTIDLCAELRVSDRTLRLAFRERFGVGPMTYYRILRLNAVRAALKGDPAAVVSDAARGYGFHHLGNFAADYRRLFGERPSETRSAATAVSGG